MRTYGYPIQHPVPGNLAGLGEDLISSSISSSVSAGINKSWPTIEANLDTFVQKYESRYAPFVLLIGAVAAAALVLSIKREMGR